MKIIIYTDGACDLHAENRPGGWATILVTTDDEGKPINETLLSGGQEMTTNNQMELMAVIEGLKSLTEPTKVTVVSDSKYVINTVTKGYQINANKELWQTYFKVAEPHKIKWKFVKGHAGHSYNERCDKLAVIERSKLAIDPAVSESAQNATSVITPVKIYLSTQVSSTKKSSAWSSIIIQDDKTKELSGFLSNTSELEAVLIGTIETLNSLETDEAITVYTAQEYLSKGMNEWMSGWLKKDWKSSTGNPVKYQDKWKALLKLSQQKTIYFQFVKHREGDPFFERGKLLASLLVKRA